MFWIFRFSFFPDKRATEPLKGGRKKGPARDDVGCGDGGQERGDRVGGQAAGDPAEETN